MSMFKKATAFLTAAGIAVSCAACGYNTVNALTVDGMEIPAGVYIYYANGAYNSAVSKLQSENADLDTTDKDAVKALTLEGKDVTTWIQDEATKSCTEYAVLEKKFEELGLTIDEEAKANLSMMKDYYWESSKQMMEKNGISEASFDKIATSSYKSDALYKYYYAVGGQEGVTDEDLYNYYKDNNIRVEYISIGLKDAEGNLLKSDGKKEMMTMIEGYRDRVEDAYAEGGVKAAQAEMAKVREDYMAYQASLTEDENAEGGEEPETVEETVEETAAETETTEAETTGTAAEEDETKAETTAAEDTTEDDTIVVEETKQLPDAPKADDAAEETAETKSDEEETAETKSDEEETAETKSDEEETTETKSDEEETSETKSDEEETSETKSDEEETEDETVEETAEDVDADDLAGSAEEDEDEDPYVNESIIGVVHEEDYDDPNAIYYTPSETVYKKLISIDAKDYGKPFIVEEDENYYLVVRYDIEDRMVANDLWNDSNIESAMYMLHDKDFQDMLDGWVADASVQRNEAAYKRYDPFKFDFT